jgi:hypothetical protein
MRRPGLLIASMFLACGASLALAAPASAAVKDTSGHPHSWYCDDDDTYYNGYGNDYYYHRHHHHRHGYYNNYGVWIGVGVFVG